MKLYGDLISPFVRMSMITAIECGLGDRVQLVHTNAKPQVPNETLQKLSPLGKIPVLETDHGHPLHDSRVIMEYFCHVAGNKVLLPDEGVKRFRLLTLLALGQGLGDAAVGLRYEQSARPSELQWPELIERLRLRITSCLDELEGTWCDTLQDVTLGSIAVAAVLSYVDYRHENLNWRQNRTELSNFHSVFNKQKSMIDTSLPIA